MTTASLSQIVAHCEHRLAPSTFTDYDRAWNGLQAENSGRVTRIAADVDASLATVELALAAKADLLLVHHGLFWGQTLPWTGRRHALMRRLFEGDLAVYSQHLPLDGHPEIGNNALLARQLGLKPKRPFLVRDGEAIGCIAPSRRSRAELRARLERQYRRVIAIEYGSASPRAVAFCSGSGNSAVPELGPAGVDTLVTGELREEWFTRAQEEKLNLYLCGHYATEVHAVQALAAELARKFRLPWRFIATDNPL